MSEGLEVICEVSVVGVGGARYGPRFQSGGV